MFNSFSTTFLTVSNYLIGSEGDPTVAHPVYVESNSFSPATLINLLISFILAITAFVVVVPEGLPLAVIISLAYTMRQMMTDKVLKPTPSSSRLYP